MTDARLLITERREVEARQREVAEQRADDLALLQGLILNALPCSTSLMVNSTVSISIELLIGTVLRNSQLCEADQKAWGRGSVMPCGRADESLLRS